MKCDSRTVGALRELLKHGRLIPLLFASSVSLGHQVVAAPAATPADLRDSLFKAALKRPKDVPLALAYAKACIEMHDYEGAIGALERVVFYAPDDANIKAQLGFLYYQLQSHQMAHQYFDQALAGPGLDDVTRTKIQSVGPAVETGISGNRLYGSLQAGIRYQTNAAFNPDNNILRLANQDYVFNHPQDRRADTNSFEVAQIGYEYDLGNQRGDTIEALFTGYGTQQFHLTALNVGLYDVSVGPRLALAPGSLPGWTVKPYAVGGQVFLAGQRYLASGGAGIVAELPVRPGYVLEPGAEVRRVEFSNVSVFSSLNSGDSVTTSLTGQAAFNETFSATARVYFNRDSADAAYQSSNNYAEELALVASFAAPLGIAQVPWFISPYVKLLQTKFDGPNPFIDAFTTRHDNELQTGLVVDTPFNERFSVVTNVQYAQVESNIPNFRLHNFSVLSGPTVRF